METCEGVPIHFKASYIVELQWLEHLWNNKTMFETGVVQETMIETEVVQANEC